jgi:hypothetical protein
MKYGVTLVESDEGWCDALPGCCSQGAPGRKRWRISARPSLNTLPPNLRRFRATLTFDPSTAKKSPFNPCQKSWASRRRTGDRRAEPLTQIVERTEERQKQGVVERGGRPSLLKGGHTLTEAGDATCPARVVHLHAPYIGPALFAGGLRVSCCRAMGRTRPDPHGRIRVIGNHT